ncbi:hypothetical protein EJ05DRAFT_507613 [Pseudovirgaria hyperparasitica]|uniref:Chloride channel protein n=1 Tax=Pseudovirgaria hyperparasitica TaxID=470096 RepID=A0A6A6WGU2_9PEZI|nr:uncharacterized protein EJ05DRAFT_507613 [Pseudovirgaria hyperparasitica]KAF2762013.1 hypothetical protein EJ05DRAFT_507613 [Pseudovirgaria hyperparasitica]
MGDNATPERPHSPTERTSLLHNHILETSHDHIDEEATSHVSKEEPALAESSIGERIPYNDYTTIDWLHDLVKSTYRQRTLHATTSRWYRYVLIPLDALTGWVAVALIGTLTAVVAFAVDVAEATVSDWKLGYCKPAPWKTRGGCCQRRTPLLPLSDGVYRGSEKGGAENTCSDYVMWSSSYGTSFATYVCIALVYGVISASATTLTKTNLPAVPTTAKASVSHEKPARGKVMFMAAGSGIPEIKTILSGFVIPNFLSLKVLLVKAFGAVFIVATGACLGKEGPFVHISTCVGYLVASCVPKYRDNGRKMREILGAACAAGLSVAFGAPLGGVLFSYEEISTFFPRKVLWRAFLCSLFAAMVLKALNPNGTGKLVLFETNYGTSYQPVHYLVFVALGIAGGVFGGVFCRMNFLWSRWFRSFPVIKNHPVFEVFLVVLTTTLLQYPNTLTREPGDTIIKNLLVDCRNAETTDTYVRRSETGDGSDRYVGFLVYGTLVKLVLTIVTFGCKVPSGVIIPALDGGAFFGRLIGQAIPGISPGIFAMVGAGAFLAGVSRMTLSLVVIMFELTGELEYVVPHMIAILVAKWTADLISTEGVYDLAQTVLGHPFLDLDHSLKLVQGQQIPLLVEELIPPRQTMDEITVHLPASNTVPRGLLEKKLAQLHRRGLLDAGLVLVNGSNMFQGYIGEGELDFGLNQVGSPCEPEVDVRLLGVPYINPDEDGTTEIDLTTYVDRTVPLISAKAPLE